MTDILTNNSLALFSPSLQKSAPQISANMAKAEQSAEDFEAFFLTRMMETMFEGVSTDGMFGGGHAEKIYRSMLLDEYGKEMAKVGAIGVKDWVMNSILQMQEMNSNAELLG